MEWYYIVLICVGAVAAWIALSALLYRQFFKRFYDLTLSLLALVVLLPLLLILTLIGAVAMKGNPFFVQQRPGRKSKKTGKEKIFKLIKFRTMSNAKGKDGNLLPDEVRLNGYGRFLRSTSLDELPELWNIAKGDLSIVGPRPLLVKYLPYYTEIERKRHTVRPGLTGYSQVHGRNVISWEKKFEMDVRYVDHLSLWLDLSVLLRTVLAVLHPGDVALNALEDFDEYRKHADTTAEIR